MSERLLAKLREVNPDLSETSLPSYRQLFLLEGYVPPTPFPDMKVQTTLLNTGLVRYTVRGRGYSWEYNEEAKSIIQDLKIEKVIRGSLEKVIDDMIPPLRELLKLANLGDSRKYNPPGAPFDPVSARLLTEANLVEETRDRHYIPTNKGRQALNSK